MTIRVTAYDDPSEVLRAAHDFLVSQPIHHNLILSLLHDRVARPQAGHYWVAFDGQEAVGVVFQSPLTFAAVLTPMQLPVVEAMVDTIVDSGVSLPGVNGDAATAASFAGQWTERTKSAAVPVHGLRLYELVELHPIRSVEGALRKAAPADRELLVEWATAFSEEIHEPTHGVAGMVDQWLAAELLWLWECDGHIVSMALGRGAVAGVVRVSHVYTPPQLRKRGYAAACVHSLSKVLAVRGFRCMLYTDLGNPTSNSIYRQIGYRAVAEGLRYNIIKSSA